MQIRKGLNSDLIRLEYCDFSFTVSQIATGPFVNNNLKIKNFPALIIKPMNWTSRRWKTTALIRMLYF